MFYPEPAVIPASRPCVFPTCGFTGPLQLSPSTHVLVRGCLERYCPLNPHYSLRSARFGFCSPSLNETISVQWKNFFNTSVCAAAAIGSGLLQSLRVCGIMTHNRFPSVPSSQPRPNGPASLVNYANDPTGLQPDGPLCSPAGPNLSP